MSVGVMMAELQYSCNMCSYGARDLDSVTSHVCRNHKNDHKFHVYCKSCLRSFTKWESYRKHIQRGCSIMPSSTVDPITTALDPNSPSGTTEEHYGDTIDIDSEDHQPGVVSQKDWYEAVYILNIKEQYVLPQVAVDKVLSSTKALLLDVLNELMNDIRGSVPAVTMQLLENKVFQINCALFKRLSSAALQRKYFKQYFDLVVSEPIWGEGAHWKIFHPLKRAHSVAIFR